MPHFESNVVFAPTKINLVQQRLKAVPAAVDRVLRQNKRQMVGIAGRTCWCSMCAYMRI